VFDSRRDLSAPLVCLAVDLYAMNQDFEKNPENCVMCDIENDRFFKFDCF
jgi:hypothetical protein